MLSVCRAMSVWITASLTDFEESMLAYASTGAKVMITEWDMSALPTLKRTANVSDTVAYKRC